MAKGDVTLKFDAQTAGFIQDMLKLRAGIDQAAGSTRQFGQDLDKTDAAGTKMAKEVTGSVLSTIGVWTSAGAAAAGAVKLVMGTAENYFDRMEKRATAFLERMQSLQASLAGSGQIAQLPEIVAQIKALSKTTGRSETDLTQIFTGTQTAMGGKATAQEVMGATTAAAESMKAGMLPEGATNVGINFATMQARGMSPTADSAFRATIAARGAMSDQAMRFLSESKNKQNAMEIIQASGMSDETMRGAKPLALYAEQKGVSIQSLLAGNVELLPSHLRGAARALKAGAGKIGGITSLEDAQAAWAGQQGSEVARAAKVRALGAKTEEAGGPEAAAELTIENAREALYIAQNPKLSLVPGSKSIARHMQSNEEVAATPFGSYLPPEESIKILTAALERNSAVTEANTIGPKDDALQSNGNQPGRH